MERPEIQTLGTVHSRLLAFCRGEKGYEIS